MQRDVLFASPPANFLLPEIWLAIFSHFIPEKLWQIQLVSRWFYHIVNDPYLQNLTFQCHFAHLLKIEETWNPQKELDWAKRIRLAYQYDYATMPRLSRRWFSLVKQSDEEGLALVKLGFRVLPFSMRWLLK
jgi:hypothetical protein